MTGRDAIALSRRRVCGLVGLPVLLLGGGCAPEYNWREVRPAGDHFQVMYPGKPSTASRDISLDGQPVVMRMTAAEAGGHHFAVGVLTLPEDSDAWRQRAVAAMQAQMARNIASRQPVAAPMTVPIVDAEGKPQGSVAAVRLEARGEGRPNRLVGGFVARGARAWQFVVVGQDPGNEEIQIFIESFRLLN